MKQLACLLFSLLVASAVTRTHDGFDHVRGAITAITDYTIRVETEDKTSMVLAVTSRTTLRKNGKRTPLRDLRIGDRVFVEVPKGTTEAAEIEIELPKKTAR